MNKKRIVLIVIFSFMLLTQIIFAASGTISVTAPGTAKVGDTVIYTVTLTGTKIGKASLEATYDGNMFEYVAGGSGEPDLGSVKLTADGEGKSKIIFNLKLRPLKKGEGKINIKSETLQNVNGTNLGEVSTEKKTKIKVGNIPSNEGTVDDLAESYTQDNSFFSGTTFLFICIILALAIILGIILAITEKKRKENIKKALNEKDEK